VDAGHPPERGSDRHILEVSSTQQKVRCMGVPLIVLVVATALVFDFTNGFHDTANAMATSISTGALRPRVAVALAALLNLAGVFLSVQVAKTISGGLVDDAEITPVVIFAGLVGATLWNLLTWLLGLPSSSSHALFGGLIGAALVVRTGCRALRQYPRKDHLLAVIAPILRGPGRTRCDEPRVPGHGQCQRGQTGLQAWAGGVGIVGRVGPRRQRRPEDDGCDHPGAHHVGRARSRFWSAFWVILTAGVAIASGTYMGGWRIIRTLGGATIILFSTYLGLPLSTTQVCHGRDLRCGSRGTATDDAGAVQPGGTHGDGMGLNPACGGRGGKLPRPGWLLAAPAA
jgi:inorganic phosphate transporter, PiT family